MNLEQLKNKRDKLKEEYSKTRLQLAVTPKGKIEKKLRKKCDILKNEIKKIMLEIAFMEHDNLEKKGTKRR